jgi:heme o synthase
MSTFWQLIRPRLLLAVLFPMAVAALTAAEPPPAVRLANALVGAALVIAGASAMNQLIERRRDARMERTALRPLLSGRLTGRQVALVAAIASLGGIAELAAMATPAVAILAATAWAVYVLIYTSLKRASVWHIPVGALAGAMPVLLGAATAGEPFTRLSLTLFGIVFFWQFSHTAAIGWIYRQQYAHGGMMVAAVVDPSGRLAGRLAVLGAVGLLLASLVPVVGAAQNLMYLAIVLPLGLTHTVVAFRFLMGPSDARAQTLWRISLFHLPLLLTALLFVRG